MDDSRGTHGAWVERDDVQGGLVPAFLLQLLLCPSISLGLAFVVPAHEPATFLFATLPAVWALGQCAWLGPLYGHLVRMRKPRCARGVAIVALGTALLASAWAAVPFVI